MTDLAAKFSALGTALGDKIDILGSKLDTLGTKLDAILTALTSGGGNIDAAPIVAAIDALRGTAPDNTLERLSSAIFGLAGTAPGRTLTDVYDLFSSGEGIRPYNLIDNMYTKLVTIDSSLNEKVANGGNLYSTVDSINKVLGGIPYNSPAFTTVLVILEAMLFYLQRTGILPDGNVSSYSQSDTTLTLGGLRYVVWPALLNITESTDMTELTPATSWSGYSIYIQTSAPSAKLHDITTPAASIDAISVNSWVDLGGSDTLAFSVDASYVVKGYLRAPSVPPSTNSYTIASATIVANGYSFSAIVWPAEFDAVITRGVFVTGDSRWILLGNYQNWTFKTIPGVQYMRDSDGVDIATHDLGTGWGIIDAVTTSVTFSMGGGNTNPFVLTFNRPA